MGTTQWAAATIVRLCAVVTITQKELAALSLKSRSPFYVRKNRTLESEHISQDTVTRLKVALNISTPNEWRLLFKLYFIK